MKRIAMLLLAVMLLATGCARTIGGGAKVDELTAGLKPGNVPMGRVDDASPLTAFAQELFAAAAALEATNPVISPLSAYLCLALVANGASGETAAEFADVLGCEADELNALCHALIAALTDTEGATKLAIANSAWADDDQMAVDPDYLKRVVDHYGADAFSADLPSREALDAINAWVNERTNGLIPKLQEEPYSPDTVLVLLNALYFKAEWARKFAAYSTRDKDFTLENGGAVSVPFLGSYGDRDLILAPDAEGILLPYDDGKTAFIALRPTDGRTARAFAMGLTADALAAYLGAAKPTYANFSMPKFTVEFSLEMNDVLRGMGLITAFDPAAANLDRLGTAASGNVYVSRVLQKVKLIVDEEGTEAAAVTEGAAPAGGSMEEPVQLHLDSPFVYAVVDLATGAPLFIGVLDDPAA